MQFNGKLCEWRIVEQQDFPLAVFKSASEVSRTVQASASSIQTK